MVARPFSVNPVMTAIAIGYRNDAQDLIADQVMPRVPVMAEQYKWVEYPTHEMFTVPNTLVGRRGRVERVEFSGIERSGSTKDYGLEDGIPISDIRAAAAQRAANLGNFDPENRAAEGLTNLLLLDREVRVAAKVQDPTNYAPARRLALSGSDRFSDPASKPISVLKAAFASTLIVRPNTMVMGRDAWTGLSSNPELVNAIKGNVTSKGIISPEELVRLFAGEGLKRILIGESFVNINKPGQTAQLNRVWGKSIQLLHVDPNTRPEQGGVTWGFTAQYGTRIAGSWEDKDVGLEGGKIVRVGEKVEEQIVARDAGFIIQNAVE
ncbi:capsid protein [Methylorubrum zatmanii]